MSEHERESKWLGPFLLGVLVGVLLTLGGSATFFMVGRGSARMEAERARAEAEAARAEAEQLRAREEAMRREAERARNKARGAVDEVMKAAKDRLKDEGK